MREIKFRIWDKFQEKYIFTGFHVIGEITFFNGVDQVLHDIAKERIEINGYKSLMEAWNDFIIEEFTGLKDKNNKDIYEGDVCNMKYYSGNNFKKMVVLYEKANFVLQDITPEKNHFWICSSGILEIEIIGNIHENLKIIEVDE